MRFVFSSIAAIAMIFLSLSPVNSAEKRVVPANKTSGIGFIYYSTSVGHNCQTPGRAKYKLSREAKHGSVRLEWRKIKGDFHRGCKNTTMSGLAMFYTPHKGYRGNDEFVVHMTTPGMGGPATNQSRSWKIKIEVK